LKSSTVLKVHPVAVTCERLKSPKPPFGGRKSGTPKNPKARKDRSRRPKKIRKPQWTPELAEGIQRLQEEFLLLRKGSFPSSSGERVSLPLPPPWGGSSGTSKPGVSSKRRETEEGFSPKSPRGNQRPHAQRKPNKQFTAGDLVLRWAYSSLHAQAMEFSQGVPRGTPKGTPFPLKPGGTGGSACYGEFESPRRNTASGSSSFLQGLPHPWIVERCNRTFREGSLVLWFHHKKRTEEVEKRKRRDSSLGRGALGGAERYWTFQVSHMMWTYTPVGCPPRSQSGFLVLPPSSPSPQR